jgi:hypothetical protein
MGHIKDDGFGTIMKRGETPDAPTGGGFGGGGGGGSGLGNMVVLAPNGQANPDPLPTGWYRTWAEAVTAIQALTAPSTVLKIMLNPDEDSFQIPGGTWQLNNTLISGFAVSADTDTNFRGWQELLNVYTEGNSANRCKIRGCIGLQNIYFRSNEQGTDTATTDNFTMPNNGDTVGIEVSDTVGFEVDRLLYMNTAGYFRIVSIDGLSTVIRNEGATGNASGGTNIPSGQNIWPDDSVFHVQGWDGFDTEFTLDNADFHYGNYRFGSFHVENGGIFVHMKNAASTRWYAWRFSNGYGIFETDGSTCWIGSQAWFGDGQVEVFPSAGTQVRRNQSVIGGWTLHQPTTVYLPDDNNDWPSGVPETIHEALDLLASNRKYLPSYAYAKRTAPQTDDLTTGDHIKFNTYSAENPSQSYIVMNDSDGNPECGRFVLQFTSGNNVGYKLRGSLGSLFDGTITIQWWDVTNNQPLGNVTGNAGSGTPGEAVAIIFKDWSASSIVVELRLTFAQSVTFIGENTSGGFILPWAMIETIGSPQ